MHSRHRRQPSRLEPTAQLPKHELTSKQQAKQNQSAVDGDASNRIYVMSKLAVLPSRANDATKPSPITRCEVGNNSVAKIHKAYQTSSQKVQETRIVSALGPQQHFSDINYSLVLETLK